MKTAIITEQQLVAIQQGIETLFNQRTSYDQESGTDNHILDYMNNVMKTVTGGLGERPTSVVTKLIGTAPVSNNMDPITIMGKALLVKLTDYLHDAKAALEILSGYDISLSIKEGHPTICTLRSPQVNEPPNTYVLVGHPAPDGSKFDVIHYME